VSLTARLPANLDATDWQMMLAILDAVRQALPNANARPPSEILEHVLDALRMANAPTIEG
jgi:hypothetical protein